MYKKFVAVLILLSLCCFCPVFADGAVIQNGDFEGGDVPFTNTTTVQNVDGSFTGILKSETVSDENGVFLHEAEYLYTLNLTAGKMYTINMEVAEDGGDGEPSLNAEYSYSEKTLVLNIENAGNQLQKVSTVFVANESEISLKICAATKSRYGILIDNISITESEVTPVGMEIIGTRNAFVPPYDYETYTYSAVAIDEQGNIIPGIKGGIEFDELPFGIKKGTVPGTIIVTNSVNTGELFTVRTVAAPGCDALAQKEIKVKLVNNYIENGNFEDFPSNSGFETESGSMEIVSTLSGNVARIQSVESDSEYKASILVEKTYVLTPGKMYVLRAKAYSENGFTSRYTTVSKGRFSKDGYIDIDISNLGEETTDIVSVIRVLNEGIYKIRLNFTNPDRRSVFIRDIGLFEEVSTPSEILIKAPAHITESERETKVPVLYAARDQEGNIIQNMPGITLKLENGNDKVFLEEGYLHVKPGAKNGKYTLVATSELVSKKAYVEISAASVGDGGFEKYAPGEWFSTAEPSDMHFVDYKNYGFEGSGEKAARLTMGGSVSAVLSDSVYNFKAGEVYVFGGSFMQAAESNMVLSLLLCNVEDINYTDTVAVMQTALVSGKMRGVFTAPRDMCARLMMGFTDEGSGQTILFDDIYLEKAQIYCDGVDIIGYPYVSKILTGKHNLRANFDGVDISTYRWLISKEKDGVYMPIEGHNDKSITVLEDMVNSYVKFEVTPVTLNGPVFGESVISEPVLIKEMPMPESGGNNHEEETQQEEKETDKGLGVIDIYSADKSKLKPFVDIENHWAKDDINILSAASIVNGKKNQLFMPDEQVTRAEIAAFIARTFKLTPLQYAGTFDDVKKHHWYSGVVETAAKYGIANGVGNKLFMPDEPVTREQIATMVIRAMSLSGVEIQGDKTHSFNDDVIISDYAKEYVYKGVNAGIIYGFDDGEFKPSKTATRAEAVVMIKRMITYVLDNQQ